MSIRTIETVHVHHDSKTLDLGRPDASVTRGVKDNAREVYAKHVAALQANWATNRYEERVLTNPDVAKAVEDARHALDAWKRSL